jgi:HAD superfamily hydrolase (TIGR01490 family)
MKKIAFFDIDGTLFRSSLLIELIEEMIKKDIFPKEARDIFKNEKESWMNRTGDYSAYINAVIRSYLTHIKGVHYGDMAEIGKDIVKKHGSKVYRYTRNLIKELKSKGYTVVAISQSPKRTLDDFCAQYGFDKVYGRIYEIGPQDRFTGKIVDEHLIENKANIVKRMMETDLNYTLKDSIAVGDTESDISLLEMVENPICFNPNQGLLNHAKLMKWKVVVERKDVIYQIQ